MRPRLHVPTATMVTMPDHHASAGENPDAARAAPEGTGADELDFEFRPGEASDIADTAAAQAAARRFREVLGRYASAVTVVTSVSDGIPVGLTCQSFSSVSLDPPLVMFVPARTSRAWPLIQRSGHFCVNFLSADQVDLSEVMASRGTDKFAGVPWTPSHTGAPLLEGIIGYVDCTVHAVHDGGDHFVVLGRVQDMGVGPDDRPDPLLYFEGRYRSTR